MNPKIERCMNLVGQMVQHGLVDNNAAAVKEQMTEALKWTDEALGAMERVVASYIKNSK